MDQHKINAAINALTKKGVNKPCPRCGHMKFSVVGESLVLINEDPSIFQIGGPSIPTIIIACDNCGYITQHAKLPLGLPTGGNQ